MKFNNPRIQKGFGQATSLVMRDPEISLRDKGLYAYLCTYANATNNELVVSVHRMASECGVTTSTIKRALESLEERGIIARIYQGPRVTKLTVILK